MRRVNDGLPSGGDARRSAWSRSWTARASRSSTTGGTSSRRARAATARRARRSPRTCGPSAACPLAIAHTGQDHAARRGAHLPEGPGQVQRRARGRGARAVRQPAERGGRRGADARRARGAQAPAARALLPARRGAEAPRDATPSRSRWLAEQGIPSHRLEKTRDVASRSCARAIDAIDAAREGYPYETDGAVVKVDDYRQEEILGFTSKFPKWAIAYKFAAEQARTIVREIVVQVGRTGALTPVAVLDPVELGGTTVSRASLHNGDMIAQLDVRIGDTVFIQKAGEIIPQVVGVDHTARARASCPRFEMPTRCPVCGTPVAARLRDEADPEGGTRGDRALPEPRVPGADQGADLLLRAALRDGRRPPRDRARRSARRQGDRPRRRRPLRAHAGAGRERSSGWGTRARRT